MSHHRLPVPPSARPHRSADRGRRQILKAIAALSVGPACFASGFGVTAAFGADAGAAASAAGGPGSGAGAAGDSASASGPKLTRGKPGDFDFLSGEWRIHHRFYEAAKEAWIEFDGEATCWSILGGICSVEELRIPARNFNGMGLRLLDVEKKLWVDHWVNARSGVLSLPGTTGSFESGAGIFISEEQDGDVLIKYRGVWDRITTKSCRWFQGASRDGGKTWNDTWFMDWRRA